MLKASTKHYSEFDVREVIFSDVEELNRILEKTALEDPGWLHDWDKDWLMCPIDIHGTKPEILLCIEAAIQEIDKELRLLDAWYTQRSRGEGNPLHDHNPGDYSGFYVISNGGSKSGATTFVKDGKELSLPPVEGRVVIFPSTLQHRVEVHEGNGTRLTLAFNFVKESKNEKTNFLG